MGGEVDLSLYTYMFTLTKQRKQANRSSYTYVFTMIMLATLNQLHTYLVDTSPPQTGDNEDIYTCITWTLLTGSMGIHSKYAVNILQCALSI